MNKKTSSAFSALFGLGLLVCPLAARATTFEFDATNPPQSSGAGIIDSITSTYDSTNHELTWTATLTSNGTSIPDSFWLVLSNGPNPKGISDQLPIIYFDGSHSFDASGNATGVAPTLSAYAYNGVNGNNSYSTPGVDLLSSLGTNWNASNSLLATGNDLTRTLSFSINTSLLDNGSAVGTIFAADSVPFNSANWEGAGYGSQVGIWFHPDQTGTDPTYGVNGFLTSFPVASQSSYDTSYQTTTVVPEPSSALLLTLAGMVLVHRRARRTRA